MSKRKVFDAVMSGRSDANLDFDELCRLVVSLGFLARKPKGSHRVFWHERVPEIINVQPRGHHAKPYQVKQVRDLILRHNLSLLQNAD